MDRKYHRKYTLIKRRIKDMIFENASLLDRVSEIQDSVSRATEERTFLMRRLLQHEPDYVLPEGVAEKNTAVKKKTQNPDRIKCEPNRMNKSALDNPLTPRNGRPAAPLEPYTKAKVKIEQQQPPVEIKLEENLEPEIEPYAEQSPAGNSYAIDNLVIQSLGVIHPEKPTFHCERWIYPIGYTSIRIFGSMKDPLAKSVYTCRVAEVGGNPRFEMSSEADPEVMIVGPSPQFCHSTLLNYLRDTHGLDKMSHVEPDGDWFFGLSHPVVMSLIEGMPNFKACPKFKGFAKVHNGAMILDRESDPAINFESFIQLISSSHENLLAEGDIKEELVVDSSQVNHGQFMN